MMDNRLLLNQARKAIAFQIAQSPANVSVAMPTQVDNGYGGYMDDPSGAHTDVTERGRISHERNEIQRVGQVPSGLDTALSLWYLGPSTCIFQTDDIMTNLDTGEVYKLGPRDELRKFGGIQAVQFPLYPAGPVPS